MSKWRDIAIQCLNDEAKAVTNLIPNLDDDFEKAIELILNCKGKVVITGVGKSGHVGAKIAATLSSTGTSSFYVSPLDMYHGDLGVISSDDIVLAISYSGQTEELLKLIPSMAERNIPIICMTGYKNSLLAQHSVASLCIYVEEEARPLKLAPTCSSTATLAMGDALACSLMVAHGFSPDTKLGEAVTLVSQGRLGICIAVENDKVVGLVTDGDIRRSIENSQSKFFDLTVGDIMTKKPRVVSRQTRIIDVDKILNTNNIHCVLVVDDKMHLLGVVDSFSTIL